MRMSLTAANSSINVVINDQAHGQSLLTLAQTTNVSGNSVILSA
jgi:hypothetical protein